MRTRSGRLARFGALSVVAALALGGPLAAAAVAGGREDPETLATLQVEKDNVEVRKAGKDAFKAAKDEQKLNEGDTIRTDDTGRAEIQYDDESYTRLDVNTAFTIESLTDDQGNRQVEGSLDTGRTWNRAEGLTESESFEQSGAGATAAVQGTAFAIECVSATECNYVGAVADATLEGNNEQQVLLTLDLCLALSGDLCNELSKLGPGDLFNWIQENLLRDLLERGLGPGPFILNFQDGQLTVITPPAEGTSATPIAAPVVLDPTNPIACENGCDGTLVLSLALPPGFEPGSSIQVFEGNDKDFVANVITTPTGLFVVFTALPDSGEGGVGRIVIPCGSECDDDVVVVNTPYAADTIFRFVSFFVLSTQTDTFVFHIQDGAGNRVTGDASINVTVENGCGPSCLVSASSGRAGGEHRKGDAPPSSPPADAPADPPPADPPAE